MIACMRGRAGGAALPLRACAGAISAAALIVGAAGASYPAVLFVSGDSDTRVAPLHARKMAALLQASTGSDRPVRLAYDTTLGHSRAGKPLSSRIEEDTTRMAFLFWQLAMIGARPPSPEADTGPAR